MVPSTDGGRMVRAVKNTWTEIQFETVTLARDGTIVLRERHAGRRLVLPLRGGVSLELMAIPAGAFEMGCDGNEGWDDERPVHRVEVPAFALGRYEVTQEQWQAVMGRPHSSLFHGPERPVDRLSWFQAVEFCDRLARRTGFAFRLPSEAEWEYACRAGTTTPFYCGPTITTDQANYVGLHTYLHESAGVYRHATTDVGSFAPNAFGLHDMTGNLWEWCADTWHRDYRGAPSDGSVWQGGDEHFRVVRGGCWHDPPDVCRCACRLKFPPYPGEDFVGFRVAVSLGSDGYPALAAGDRWPRWARGLARAVGRLRR